MANTQNGPVKGAVVMKELAGRSNALCKRAMELEMHLILERQAPPSHEVCTVLSDLFASEHTSSLKDF